MTNALGGRSEFPDVLRCVRGDGATSAYPWAAIILPDDEAITEADADYRKQIEALGWRQTAAGWQCGQHAPESGEILDNHNVIRDGSHWLCRFCGRTWPFPSPLPDDAGPCVQRAWRVES